MNKKHKIWVFKRTFNNYGLALGKIQGKSEKFDCGKFQQILP